MLGDYKAVNGWYLPHSYRAGSQGKQPEVDRVVYDRIEANVPLDDSLFRHAGRSRRPRSEDAP